MNNFFRAIIAGYGAKKLGGGCFGTIIVFILIWVALGQCSFSSRHVPPPETYPADRRASNPVETPYIKPLISVWEQTVTEGKSEIPTFHINREMAGSC